MARTAIEFDGTACEGIIHEPAPEADLVSVRVLGPDNRTKVTVFAARLDWAIRNRARVVNLSLSSKSDALYGLLRDLADSACFSNVLLSYTTPIPRSSSGRAAWTWRWPGATAAG